MVVCIWCLVFCVCVWRFVLSVLVFGAQCLMILVCFCVACCLLGVVCCALFALVVGCLVRWCFFLFVEWYVIDSFIAVCCVLFVVICFLNM